MGEGIRKYGTGFSPVARRGSVGVDTKDASRPISVVRRPDAHDTRSAAL